MRAEHFHVEHLTSVTASSLAPIYWTTLKKLVRDKHSSLFCPTVTAEEKSFVIMTPVGLSSSLKNVKICGPDEREPDDGCFCQIFNSKLGRFVGMRIYHCVRSHARLELKYLPVQSASFFCRKCEKLNDFRLLVKFLCCCSFLKESGMAFAKLLTAVLSSKLHFGYFKCTIVGSL